MSPLSKGEDRIMNRVGALFQCLTEDHPLRRGKEKGRPHLLGEKNHGAQKREITLHIVYSFRGDLSWN